MIMAQRKPVHYEMKVRTQDDIDARVVRSTSGTIRIPELGVDIEPGPASESFISNIEGVLDRVSDILEMVVRWNEEDKTSARRNYNPLSRKSKPENLRLRLLLKIRWAIAPLLQKKQHTGNLRKKRRIVLRRV